jgi:hypothetical protein
MIEGLYVKRRKDETNLLLGGFFFLALEMVNSLTFTIGM